MHTKHPFTPLAAYLSIALLIVLSLLALGPHVPPLAMVVSAPLDGEAHLSYDNGYGFNGDQRKAIPVVREAKEAEALFKKGQGLTWNSTLLPGMRLGVQIDLVAKKVSECPAIADLLIRPVGGDEIETEPLVRNSPESCTFSTPNGFMNMSRFSTRSQGVLVAVDIVAGLVGALPLTLLFLYAQRVRRHPKNALLFGALFLWYSVWVYGQWPGLIGWDSTSGPMQTLTLGFSSWYSTFYPLIYAAIYQLTGGFGSMAVLHAACLALLVASVVFYVRSAKVSLVWTSLFLLVFCAHPVVLSYNSFFTRDALLGFINSGLLFLTFVLLTRPQGRHVGLLAAFVFLAFLTTALRMENIVLVFASLLAQAFVRKEQRRATGALACVFVVLAGLWHWGVGPALTKETHDRKNAYLVTTFVAQAGAMFHEKAPWGDGYIGYMSDDYERDIREVSPVIDPQIFRDKWSPYGAVYFTPKHSYPDKDVDGLKRFIFRSTLYNPEIFFGARATTFAAVLGSPRTWFISDFSKENMKRDRLMDLGLWRGTPHKIYRIQRSYLKSELAHWREVNSPLAYIWSAWPQFMLVIFFALLGRWLPSTATVSFIMLMRLGILFMTAPASHFFYAYDLFVFGLVLPLLAVTEAKLNRCGAACRSD
ncbi:MAG: hypothetical protein PHE27_00650 [Alphaproteobacteria bacterium]|nr:hypothetical protein [Alphaproteobacteria bacterium]